MMGLVSLSMMKKDKKNKLIMMMNISGNIKVFKAMI